MARIRSVHPGQWTDGDFLECSPLARLLALAIRNIADDRGAFRWKPTTIKATCLPADNCVIDALLEELVQAGQIIKYEIEGKTYGLVRDFCQWQRPKKPQYVHPVPKEFDTSSEPEPNQFDTNTEKPPQREEVGGRRKEEGGKESERERAREAIKPDWKASKETVRELISLGFDLPQLESELPRFVAHYRAKGEGRSDWGAALVKWMLGARQRGDVKPSARASPVVPITPDSAEWQAWWSYHSDRKNGVGKSFGADQMKAARDAGKPYMAASQWPPGHQPAERAA